VLNLYSFTATFACFFSYCYA